MKMSKLKTTLRGWVGRYGSEAAFVGRVALAAFLPAGCDRLLAQGLEAAFEYLQGKSDVISDQDLVHHLDQLGVPHGQLDEAVHRMDQEGGMALERVYQARQAGIPENTLIQQLRELIAHDPTLQALQGSMSQLAEQLGRVEAQGELLIAGQQYQTAAIEEMMAMMHAIAAQVGLSPESASTPPPAPSPSEQLFSLSMSPRGAEIPSERSAEPAQSLSLSPLDQLDVQSRARRTAHDAQDLVERFMREQKSRAGDSHLERREAVALVQRFQDQLKRRHAHHDPPESPHVGRGRVALVITSMGEAPVMIIKWLCEERGYALQDAIISTQTLPCVVRRDDNFIRLSEMRSALEQLGARAKIQT